jgi:integrase
MASKRKKGARWEFVIKRAGLLERPVYLTFATEEEGDTFCRNVEALLDQGIVPHDIRPESKPATLGSVIRAYMTEAHPSGKDLEVLSTVLGAKGATAVLKIDARWVDGWIAEMKQLEKLAPATIRAKIGATARACDWAIRRKLIALPDHPFRTLPDGYATYNATDAALAGGVRQDVERDRRLEADEEPRIRAAILAGVLPRKQRPRALAHPAELLADFDLALETGMRMRERYTLACDQVDLRGRQVVLDRTKNGDSREVPLSSVAMRVLGEQLARRQGARWLWPWFDGDFRPYALKMRSNWLSKLYADVFDAAGCPDLREHDLRHEATSRFFERTDLRAEEIMRITGHKTHKMVMRYLRLRAHNLAVKLW